MRSTRLSDKSIMAQKSPGRSSKRILQLSRYIPRRMLLVAAVVLFVVGGIGPNYILAIGAIIAIILGVNLLWRPGETPILLYIFFYQWLQVSLPVFHANWLGLTLKELSEYHGNLTLAFVLSTIGLTIVAIGLRLGASRPSASLVEMSRNQAMTISLKDVFLLYLLSFVIANVAGAFAGSFGGLRQVILATLAIRWALYFVLVYVSFIKKQIAFHYWVTAFVLEFLVSIGGFFSDFKTVFLFTFFAMFAAKVKVTLKQAVILAIFGVMLLFLGAIWSAIKVDYRDYVSGGTGQQVVVIGYQDRLNKLGGDISDMDAADLDEGFDLLLRRTSYIEFFGRVVDVVPTVISHTGGSIWFDALSRPFMPRLLFPNKSIVDDTQRTSRYTGVLFQGATSVSIGYMAEAYIDFGPVGMMILLFGYGYILGRLYKWMVGGKYTQGIYGMGMATAVLFVAAAFESSITKVTGGVAVSFLVTWIFARWIIPSFFSWLRIRKVTKVS